MEQTNIWSCDQRDVHSFPSVYYFLATQTSPVDPPVFSSHPAHLGRAIPFVTHTLLYFSIFYTMLRWVAAFLGFEPIKNPCPQDTTASQTNYKSDSGRTDWPEGPQVRKHVRYSEPNGWAHSDWSWRSKGKVEYPGSIHPDLDKAEYRLCLGALECQGCGMVVRPKTSTGGMKAQLEETCPDGNCDGIFRWVTCNARTYHFAIKEDGIEYSVWKHTGSHSSHPHPPRGRQPPGIHGAPDEARASACARTRQRESTQFPSIAPAHQGHSESGATARKVDNPKMVAPKSNAKNTNTWSDVK